MSTIITTTKLSWVAANASCSGSGEVELRGASNHRTIRDVRVWELGARVGVESVQGDALAGLGWAAARRKLHQPVQIERERVVLPVRVNG